MIILNYIPLGLYLTELPLLSTKSNEVGISRAEIVRQLGVCTSVIAKTIQNIEVAKNKC